MAGGPFPPREVRLMSLHCLQGPCQLLRRGRSPSSGVLNRPFSLRFCLSARLRAPVLTCIVVHMERAEQTPLCRGDTPGRQTFLPAQEEHSEDRPSAQEEKRKREPGGSLTCLRERCWGEARRWKVGWEEGLSPGEGRKGNHLMKGSVEILHGRASHWWAASPI